MRLIVKTQLRIKNRTDPKQTDLINVPTGQNIINDPQADTNISHQKELEIFNENPYDLKDLSKFINEKIDELMSYEK